MEQGWIKFNRTHDSLELLKKPKVWALLSLIAIRAKRTNSISVYNLEPGEAMIGDHKECGFDTE